MFISELLERCIKMRTTNHNESINSHIWRRAPKHLPLWKPTVDIVVAMAVLEFNKGSSGFISVLENLSILSGHHFMIYIYHLSFRKRRKDAARHASTSTMKSRLSRKLFKAGITDQREAKECSMRLVALITDYSVVHCILFNV